MTTRKKSLAISVLLAVVLGAVSLFAQESKFYLNPSSKPIPSGSRIYVAPMANGFENYIVAGIMKKKVPVVIVNDKSKADYEISGVSDTEKAGWAKMLFMGSQQSNEQASFQVVELKSGDVVFAYSVNKINSRKGKQSAGEACAKHLKDKINTE